MELHPATGHRDRRRFMVVTNAVSLARQLWRYGEPDLAERAAALGVEDVADIGIRAAELADTGEPDRSWPAGPGFIKATSVLASIERLEGAVRAPARDRRLPEKRLPEVWQVPEAELWEATALVRQEIDRRPRGPQSPPPSV